MRFVAGLMLPLLASGAGETRGHLQQHAGDTLGSVRFPISCERVQPDFDRAVALLHHMTYPQARQAFERIAEADPRCAMAQWGIAMTLFQPLWPTRPTAAALQRGWEAVRKAKALQLPTERERLYVEAVEAFFLEPASTDYWLRIRRWEAAAQRVYASFPDDPEAAALYALAHLAVAPSNRISRDHSDRAAGILLRVYERNADHPGAMHYLVHANDVPGRERESLEITRKYEAVAPHNPHALHMPTHLYTRFGDWDAVIRGNMRAAKAALEHPAGERGEFVWDEFPHAIEYLVYAHLQKAADAAAAEQLKRLRATARLEPTFKTAFHLSATQARYTLERRAWREAAQLVPREPASLDWNRFTWPEGIVRFARGLGAVHLGRIKEARADSERLAELEAATRKAGEDLFARNIRVLRLELDAWLAHANGQHESAVALMQEAVEIEISTPKHAVTPGPILPAHELLGDLLMEQHKPAEALAAYQRSLEHYPNRFNGLLGSARAARAAGNESLARTAYQQLLAVGAGGTRRSPLMEARNYVRTRRAHKSFVIPALEIVAMDGLVNLGGRTFMDPAEYAVSLTSIRRNLQRQWVVDEDVFAVNQFLHPYQGAMYHGIARTTGHNYWTSVAYTFIGSALWEIAGETTAPSRNDQIASGIAGSFLGEPMFRVSRMLLDRNGGHPGFWRTLAATIVSPPSGINRGLFGDRFDPPQSDVLAASDMRLQLGVTADLRGRARSLSTLEADTPAIGFSVEYGFPGDPQYTHTRAFDYFRIEGLVSSEALARLTSRGLVAGKDFGAGQSRGVWGVYGGYEYFEPEVFRLSSTSLSFGMTTQSWLRDALALQSTLLIGAGYTAAHAADRDKDDYHYGVAPQALAGLRIIAGRRAAIDLTAREYFISDVAGSGTRQRDRIFVGDASVAVRLGWQHALAVTYLISQRDARLPDLTRLRQSQSTLGLFYTFLGSRGFGAVR